jgi:uncharacterized protein YciI
MRFFILSYSRGVNWIEGQPRDKLPLGPHVAYLRALHGKSTLVMAGPIVEGGRMAIIQTSSVEDARAIAEADPGVIAGTLRVEVFEWRLIDWERLSPSSVEFVSGTVALFGQASERNPTLA